MTLSECKVALTGMREISFQLPNGTKVPPYFHVTEIGSINKEYVDCGGKIRKENFVTFQLWVSDDYDHRLQPAKLISIISQAEKLLSIDLDAKITIEYQDATIGKYSLALIDGVFQLQNMQTACLAEDACGIPMEKQKMQLKELTSSSSSCCEPGGGCC